MKTTICTRYFKVFLVTAIMVAVTMPANAYDFMVDGLCYNINDDETSVTVTYERTNSPSYSALGSSLSIPESVTFNGITYLITAIGDSAFYECTDLTNVSISNSVTEIGKESFSCCTELASATIGNSVISIGEKAFYFCKLTTLTIPNMVTSIGDSAFEFCRYLTTVTIPNSVTYIGEKAFYYCLVLTSVSIGSSVTSFGDYAFHDCSNLKTIRSYIRNPQDVSYGYEVFGMVPSYCSVYIPYGAENDYETTFPWSNFHNFIEMPPIVDVNGDGNVTAADVTSLYNFLLNNDTSNLLNGDVNGDGNITASDVTAVYDILLGGAVIEPPTITEYTVNGVTFRMVKVDGGSFTMGSSAEDNEAYNDEIPAHQVTLNSFSIGMTEVTQELWVAVMGSNPSWFNGIGSSDYGSTHEEDFGINLQRPIEWVSWTECQEFITMLNQITGKDFRLPTEAEWEYAARGGNRSQSYKYAGSNTIDDVAWYRDNSLIVGIGNQDYGTHTVATKAPNELGLYDMSGNVSEWCYDWYDGYYYRYSPSENPTGPETGSLHVPRGGAYTSKARYCRVAARSNWSDYSSSSIGLRLAM